MATTERPDGAVARSRDVNVRAVLLSAFWLAVTAIVVSLGTWALFRVFAKEARGRDKPLPAMVEINLRRTPAEPRLEPRPLAPRTRLQEEETAILTTYGWVDQSRGVARLPIGRAMDLIAQRGLPPSKPMAAAAPMPAPGAAPPASPAPQVK